MKENKLKRISPVFYLHMFGAALFLAAGVVGFAAGRGGIAFLPLGGYALFLLLSWAQGAAADAFLYAAPSRSGTALFAAFSLARAGVPLLVLYFYRNGLAGALETSPFLPAFCALCTAFAALLCAQLALALFGAFFAASTFPRKKNI